MSMSALPIEEHRFTASDGVRLRYISCGESYPVLLSSPIGLHLDFWKPLMTTKGAERFRFIALQSRGLWGSQASVDPANDTVARHGLDIAELIGHERLGDYGALGYCGGSAPLVEALTSARQAPDTLLLVSTLFRRDRQELIVRRILEKFKQSQRPSAYRMILSVAFQAAALEFRSMAEQEICTDEKLPMYLRQLDSLYSFDFPDNLIFNSKLGIFISANDIDSIKISSKNYFEKLDVLNSEFDEIDQSDHFYLYNQPSRAIDLISKFMPCTAGEVS